MKNKSSVIEWGKFPEWKIFSFAKFVQNSILRIYKVNNCTISKFLSSMTSATLTDSWIKCCNKVLVDILRNHPGFFKDPEPYEDPETWEYATI